MNSETAITNYLSEIATFLRGADSERKRILEEVETHIRDAVAGYETQGVDAANAATRAIADFGPAATVAAGFITPDPPTPIIRGARRWLPIALPAAISILSAAVFILIWANRSSRYGLTVGERLTLILYGRHLLIALALTAVGYAAIIRADRDRQWRRAAWGCSIVALLVLVIR